MIELQRTWTSHRPFRRGFPLTILCAAVVWGVLTGCQTTTNMRLGQRAEKRGRYHVAYQYYCDEAERRPSSGAVETAIARVAPRAAQHYERQGASAAGAGDYAEAWRLYMGALRISPNSPALVQLIRILEDEHPAEIAPARAAWTKHGDRALALTSPGSRRNDRWVASRGPVDDGAAVVSNDAATEPAPVTSEEPEQPDEPEPEREPDAGEPAVRAEPDRQRSEGPYLMTAILSVEDGRFPPKTHTVDDIHVRLKDTDSDPDADLDVYLGTTRVRKARDVQPGRGIRVRGRSGKWYKVVIITIVDRTESVRIGIRADPGSTG